MPSAGSSTRCVLCLPVPPLSQWRVESSLNTDRAPVFYCCGGWEQSLNTKMTSLNWFVHIAVHNGKMPVLTHR
jgi:hypothetical protein